MDLTARQKFLDRIETFKNALDSEIMISQGLGDSEHNKRARILRNGLAIIGFTILEDFLKTRTGEVLSQVSSVGVEKVSFERLPQSLKDASIFDALQGLAVYVKQNRNSMDNAISFVQEHTAKIANTQTDAYELSPFSMGWVQSNLTHENISNSLRIFGIKGGWNAIQKVTSLANVTLPSPQESFKNAALRRHKAAHDASADSLYNDLLNYIQESTAIAFSFDTLITKSLYFISKQDKGYLKNNKDFINADNILIKFILYKNNVWHRYEALDQESIDSNSNYQELVDNFRNTTINEDKVILVKNDSNIIIDWNLYSFS